MLAARDSRCVQDHRPAIRRFQAEA
eukprot:COSAG02_NODE_58163_length_278_cov_0.737430_1_plen_24_part_10